MIRCALFQALVAVILASGPVCAKELMTGGLPVSAGNAMQMSLATAGLMAMAQQNPGTAQPGMAPGVSSPAFSGPAQTYPSQPFGPGPAPLPGGDVRLAPPLGWGGGG